MLETIFYFNGTLKTILLLFYFLSYFILTQFLYTIKLYKHVNL